MGFARLALIQHGNRMPPFGREAADSRKLQQKQHSYLHPHMRYVALAIIVCISGIVFFRLFALSLAEAQKVTSGFPTVYTAARLWLSGVHGVNLQDWEWFRQKAAGFGFTSTDVFWGNPPSLSLLLVPLVWLGPSHARVAWTFVSLLVWFAGAEWLRRTVAPGRDWFGAWIAALLLASLAALYDPFRANLHLGQIYSLLFFLECGTCVLWLRGSPLGAGVFLGAALALKGYGVPIVALALFRRERRVLAGTAASFTLLAGLASLRLGMNSWPDFLAVHLWDRSFSGTTVPALQTVRSFAGVAMLPAYNPGGPPPVLGRTADITLSLLGIVAQLFVVLWLARRREVGESVRGLCNVSSPSPCALAACVALGLIFAPHAENHAYCLALAGLVLMMPALSRINLVSAGTLVAGFLLAWPFHFQTKPVLDGFDLVAAYPRLWGVVVLLTIALLGEGARMRRTQPQQSRAPGVGFGAVSMMGLSLVGFYATPWRHPAESPLLIVSRPAANAISCFRLDRDDHEVFSIAVSCTGPFGIALGPDRRWLYATCTDNSKLSLIDLYDRRESRTIDTPRFPAWATVRPGSPEVWISNEAMGTVTIYAVPTATVLAEVQTGNGPSDICFTADGATAFVTNEASETVSWIDATARKKVRDIIVGKVPQGLALTPDERTLVVANYGSDAVSLVSLQEQREIARINIGRGPVHVAVPHKGKDHLAFVSCFEDGAISTLDLNHVRELNRLPVGKHVFGIAVYPDKKRIYACSAGTDELVVLREAARPTILQRIRVQGSPTLLRIAR